MGHEENLGVVNRIILIERTFEKTEERKAEVS